MLSTFVIMYQLDTSAVLIILERERVIARDIVHTHCNFANIVLICAFCAFLMTLCRKNDKIFDLREKNDFKVVSFYLPVLFQRRELEEAVYWKISETTEYPTCS